MHPKILWPILMTYDRLPEVCLDLLDCNCTTGVEP